VADSQQERHDANIEAMHNLYDNLAEHGHDPRRMPFVIQYNKRDLPNAMPVQELEGALNPTAVPSFEAVGTRGVGVFDTLKAVSKQVIKQLS
jgi:signal recognition particle receptor subunit beta